MDEISVLAAFAAGLISFFNPCVLPIVPGLFAYLSGVSLTDASRHRARIFLSAFFFVLGFSTIFAGLGLLLNAVLKSASYAAKFWMARSGGAFIFLFGLYLCGILRAGFLDKDRRISLRGRNRSSYLFSFLFGAAFAASWTPCVGAVLGSVLAFAATRPALSFFLLLSYALGMGLPFLVMSLFAAPILRWAETASRPLRFIKFGLGLFLIFFGVHIFIGTLHFSSQQKAPPLPALSDLSAPSGPKTEGRIALKEKRYPRAKELADADGYINTGSFRLADLIGHNVILLEFWRFECPNCREELSHVKAWHKKYAADGLEIIGVHSPQEAAEREYDAVVSFVRRQDISYRVILDNNHESLRRYGILYWPTLCLIDIDGFVVYRHIGAGDYEEVEGKIEGLLRERGEGIR